MAHRGRSFHHSRSWIGTKRVEIIGRALFGVSTAVGYTLTIQLIFINSNKTVKAVFLPVLFLLGLITLWSYSGIDRRISDGRQGRRRRGMRQTEEADGAMRRAIGQEEERRERDESVVIKGFFGPGTVVKHLPGLGSRIEKQWYNVGEIVSTPMAPRDFIYDAETMTNINHVLQGLKHPHVLPVLYVAYLECSSRFIIGSQWQQDYSLRDYINDKIYPLMDWESKYHKDGGIALASEEVASCGRQILEAMAYLYSQGFIELGCIHTGNTFVCEREEDEEEVEEEESSAIKEPVMAGDDDNMETVKVEVTFEAKPEDSTRDESVLTSKDVEISVEGEDITVEPNAEEGPGSKGKGIASEDFLEENEDKEDVRENIVKKKLEGRFSVEDTGDDKSTANGMSINKDIEAFGESTGNVVAVEGATGEDMHYDDDDDDDDEGKYEDCLDDGEGAISGERDGSGLTKFKASTSKVTAARGRAKEVLMEVKSKTASVLSKVGKKVEKGGRKVGKHIGRGAGRAVNLMTRLTKTTGLEEETQAAPSGSFTGRLFCRLGGYENILLGYKTTRYQALVSEGALDRMDLILFGHVLYEMATGTVLADNIVEPCDEDYARINDEVIREDLKTIFNMRINSRSGYQGAIEQMLRLDTFKSVALPSMPLMANEPLSRSLRQTLTTLLRKKYQKK